MVDTTDSDAALPGRDWWRRRPGETSLQRLQRVYPQSAERFIPELSLPAEDETPIKDPALTSPPVSGVRFDPDPSAPGSGVVASKIATALDMSVDPPGWANPIREELGIPLDRYLFFVTLHNPLGWDGYTFELVGIDPPPDISDAVPTFTFPNMIIMPFPGVQIPYLVAYRRQIRHRDTPVYLEACWHPTTGGTLTLKGLEKDARKKSVDRVYRGVKLFKAIEAARGRPLGSLYYPTRDAFHEACKQAWATVKRRFHRPTISRLIQILPIERSAYYDHVTLYGPPNLESPPTPN
jgi:hypothetical protein